MTPLPSIPADLVTTLGAYLRLRGERGGSFLLESVERGRLGRNSQESSSGSAGVRRLARCNGTIWNASPSSGSRSRLQLLWRAFLAGIQVWVYS